MNQHELRDRLKPLLAEFTSRMTGFAAMHACMFDRDWLSIHPGTVDYAGHVAALAELSVSLEKLRGEVARMAAQPESLTTFRHYFGALLPFLDTSRDCVKGLQAYCRAMNRLARGSGGSVAEAQRLKDLYARLGVRMHSARQAYRLASARWGV